ncbi:MAG: NADH-quinone oxidoreductase subunit F [Actinomycetia bacterium]|nr:NADH-quinone oxidoreductase subunit F [Actinomycetes bacterium]
MSMKEPVLLKRVGKMKNPASVEEYRQLGGFSAIQKAIEIGKDQILNEVDTANLRGRGGAAYPAGRKWRQLFAIEEGPKYIVCNADEGEPGTFKDKVLLAEDPLSVIEGMLVAGYLFDSPEGFIYIRGEYRAIQKVFQEAIDNACAAGLLGTDILGVKGFDYTIAVVSGAGAYVCGENSALLNSVEGKAGRPRVKPPHLAEVGLYSQPTLVNNVETFACIPVILNIGGQAFLEMGTEDGGGTKLVCLSGHIKNRGTYEVPLGTPLADLLYSEEYGGGTSSGRPVKFLHLGGQSGPLAFPEQLDGLYSYQGLADKGLAVGSGAIVVLDDSVSLVEYSKKVLEFFVHESCGKCTPCRIGTTRALELLDDFASDKAKAEDIDNLDTMLANINGLSACGLGQAAGVAVRTAIKHRKEEFSSAARG